MRTVQDIYDEYRILPNLQLHQLRVAGVAKLVCDHFREPLDSKSVITAALFHDMGNIVKFDLSRFPQFLEPEGLAHWEAVKADFVKRYGPESHATNVAIARELGLPERVVTLVDTVSFSKMKQTLETGTFEQKITEYADTRAGPFGILTIRARFLDGAERYAHRYDSESAVMKRYDEQTRIGTEIEKAIFEHCDFVPEDIVDSSVGPLLEELKHFQVE